MSRSELRPIRITPSAPAPNYAPAYLAEDLGFFADEELSVVSDINAGPGSSWLADNVIDGVADIALGGIWIPLSYSGRIAHLEAFALVCARNPQVLIARNPAPGFDWHSAYGAKVLMPMSSTSQWLYLEGALKERGYEPSAITFIRDLDESTILRLWRGGLGDFFLATPPLAEALTDEGYAVATTLAESFGDVPWSVYYTSPSYIDKADSPVGDFARGLQRALRWLHNHSSEDVARVLHARFPAVPQQRLECAIEGLRRRGVWPDSIEIPPDSYMRYQRMIADYGLIERMQPFERMVASRVAERLEL